MRRRVIRPCEECEVMQANAKFRGRYLCRRCLMRDSDTKEGYAHSDYFVATIETRHDPDNAYVKIPNAWGSLKRGMARAIKKYKIKNDYSLHESIYYD